MTLEQQSIALARHLGTGRDVQVPEFGFDSDYREVQTGWRTHYQAPFYYECRNAIADARRRLAPDLRESFMSKVFAGRLGGLQEHYWNMIDATAAEQLTAMVKTLGLWVDDGQSAKEAA